MQSPSFASCGPAPSGTSRKTTDRRGSSVVWLLIGLITAGGAAGYYWFRVRKPARSMALDRVIVQPVKRELFVHSIAQRGEIESASNIDVYCEVKSSGSGSTGI